jgi:uncharacterized protein YndB with AHSA1/START domain
MSSPFSLGTRILASAAGFLGLILLIGFLLPAGWTADAELLVEASPDAVYELLDAPDAWRRWSPWPDTGVVMSGPTRGPGATMSWANTDLGSGAFRIVEVVPGQRVRYSVEVSGGAMQAAGTLELTGEGAATRVRWHEEGDLGRNPLMGYWALSMSRAQSQELTKSLERLGAIAAAPADTVTGYEPS